MGQVVDELLLKVKLDSDTKSIGVTANQLEDASQAASGADSQFKKLENTVSKATLAFERKEHAVKNATDAIQKQSISYAGLNNTLGGVASKIFDVTNQIEQYEYQARRAGKSTAEIQASSADFVKTLVSVAVAAKAVSVAFDLLGKATQFALESALEHDKSLETLKGGLEDVKKAGEEVLTAFGSGFLGTFVEANGGIRDFAQTLRELKPIFEGLGIAVSIFFRPLIEGLKGLSEGKKLMQDLGLAAKDAGSDMEAAGKSAENAGESFFKFAQDLVKANEQMKKIGGNLTQAQIDADQKYKESKLSTIQLIAEKERQLENLRLDMAKDAAQGMAQVNADLQAKLIADIETLREKSDTEEEAKTKKAIDETAKRTKEMQKKFEDLGKAMQAVDDDVYENWKKKQDARELAINDMENEWRRAGASVESFLKSEKQAFDDEQAQQFLDILESTTVEMDKLTTSTERFGAKLKDIGTTLGMWGAIIGEAAGLADVLGASEKLTQQISDVGQAFDGAGQTAFGFGEIMSGDVLQGIQDVIGGVTKLIGALKDLFKHDWAEDTRNQIGFILDGLKLSDDLVNRIAQDAEKLGSAGVAVVLHLKDAVDELGVTAETIGPLLDAAHDLFSVLERKEISVAQAGDVLNSIFADLAAGAEKFGVTYQAQLLELIELSKRFGLSVAAIDEYIAGKISDISSNIAGLAGEFQKLIDKMTDRAKAKFDEFFKTMTDAQKAAFDKLSDKDKQAFIDSFFSDEQLNVLKHRFNELADAVIADFNAMIEQGYTWSQAMDQLGPTLETLLAAAERFGLKGNEAFQHLLDQFEKLKKLAPTLNRLQFLTNINKALTDMGSLSDKEFKHLENAANNAYNKLRKGGLTAKEALTQMIPTLQEIIREHELTGKPIDKNTQALIEQARRLGLLGDADPSATMTAGFNAMTTAINGMTTKMDDFIKALKDALGVADDLGDSLDNANDSTPDGGGKGGGFSGGNKEPKTGDNRQTKSSSASIHNPNSTGSQSGTLERGTIRGPRDTTSTQGGNVNINLTVNEIPFGAIKDARSFSEYLYSAIKRGRRLGDI